VTLLSFRRASPHRARQFKSKPRPAEVGGEWKPINEFMWKNREAFIFGRTDWEYINNTFLFPIFTQHHSGVEFLKFILVKFIL
jgi:hypothetical protein